jgi:hypothetical protein
MMKVKIIKSDFIVYSFLGLLALGSLIIPAYAETIYYSNSYPVWYSYPCADTSPTTLTHESPLDKRTVNVWRYFSYYDESAQDCFATVHTFDFQDLSLLTNTTSINYHTDTRSMNPYDLTVIDSNAINCELYYLGNPDTSADISTTPTLIASAFDCTETTGQVIEAVIPFSAGNNATLQTQIQAGNYTQSFILFPTLNATMRTFLDTNNNDYAIGKLDNSLMIEGLGFNCITIEASQWCNMYNDPWGAIKKALGEDYVGDWFYVFVFFPIPFMVFLTSRNGTYAGFVCLPILLFINTIDQVVFDISLSFIALAGAFAFYDLIRKRLVE